MKESHDATYLNRYAGTTAVAVGQSHHGDSLGQAVSRTRLPDRHFERIRSRTLRCPHRAPCRQVVRQRRTLPHDAPATSHRDCDYRHRCRGRSDGLSQVPRTERPSHYPSERDGQYSSQKRAVESARHRTIVRRAAIATGATRRHIRRVRNRSLARCERSVLAGTGVAIVAGTIEDSRPAYRRDFDAGHAFGSDRTDACGAALPLVRRTAATSNDPRNGTLSAARRHIEKRRRPERRLRSARV